MSNYPHKSIDLPSRSYRILRKGGVCLFLILFLSQINIPNGFSATGRIDGNANTASRFTVPVDQSDFNPDEFLTAAGFGGLLKNNELQFVRKNGRPGGVTYRYAQYCDNYPVIGGSIALTFDRNGKTASLYSSLAQWQRKSKPIFTIDATEALRISYNAVKYEQLRGSIIIEKVIFPINGNPAACWAIGIPALKPLGDWEVIIDGQNGKILNIENRLNFIDGSGLIFNPDPITALQDTTLQDEDDAAEAIPQEAYSEVVLNDISMVEDSCILTGPYADTEPTANRAQLETTEFFFDREDDRFEEVMAYYHIDRQARYLESLGFEDFIPAPLRINVNGVEEDLSFYSPFTRTLTTGSGGVDDAEDADVLIHEYGHALMHGIFENWRGGETLILSEGFCDYLAGDYSYDVDPDFQPYVLYNWDGHNEFWDGRILDADYAYPDIEGMNAHEAGQLWSSLLMEIKTQAENRDEWNAVAWDHLNYLGDSALICDAADALLKSDYAITEGLFRSRIIRACETREIFLPGEHSPTITHTPLNDTEDLDASREATAIIESEMRLDFDRIWLIYTFEDEQPETLLMELTDRNRNVFATEIPGPGFETDVEYYISAADTYGVFSTLPAAAPINSFIYHAGPDEIPPEIVRADSMRNTVFAEGEINYSVVVTDNIGVDAVSLRWFDGWMEFGEQINLTPDSLVSNLYTGRFHWDMGNGQLIFYQIVSTDMANDRNIVFSPMRSFSIQKECIIDNFEQNSPRWLFDGWERIENIGRENGFGLINNNDSCESCIAELDEDWNLSQFGRFRLFFWDKHRIERRNSEFGLVEISADGGDTWQELVRFTGFQNWWVRHEINLDRYAQNRESPIRLRWRMFSPENLERHGEWIIDEITLATDVIVNTEEIAEENPKSFFISEPFPNPTNGAVAFNYKSPIAGKIQILNALGRSVYHQDFQKGRGSISVSMNDQPNGVYLLQVDGREQLIRRKFLLLK